MEKWPTCPECGEDRVRGDETPFAGCTFFCDHCRHSYLWDGETSRKLTPEEETRIGWVDRCPHCKVSIVGVVNAQTRQVGRPPMHGEGFFCAFCSGLAFYANPPANSPIRALMLRGVSLEQEQKLPPHIREYVDALRLQWREQMGKEN